MVKSTGGERSLQDGISGVWQAPLSCRSKQFSAAKAVSGLAGPSEGCVEVFWSSRKPGSGLQEKALAGREMERQLSRWLLRK